MAGANREDYGKASAEETNTSPNRDGDDGARHCCRSDSHEPQPMFACAHSQTTRSYFGNSSACDQRLTRRWNPYNKLPFRVLTHLHRAGLSMAPAHSMSSGSPSEELPDESHETVGDSPVSCGYSSASFAEP